MRRSDRALVLAMLAMLAAGATRAHDFERDEWLLSGQSPVQARKAKPYDPLEFDRIRMNGNGEETIFAQGPELELIAAAERNDREAVEKLLAHGINPNRTDGRRGKRALVLAVRNGNVEMVRILLDAGADPDLPGHGFTPLGLAAFSGQTQVAHLLLRAGADVNVQGIDGNTPLILAAAYNRVEIARKLLAHKPDFSLFNRDGKNPVAAAALEGNIEILRMMLEAGASPNEPGKSGSRPIFWAASRQQKEAVKLLQEYGGTPF
jgi:ankyrin repeat protein